MRFSGHTNEWQTKRIDTLFEFVPNNTISRDGLNYDGGGWKNIHYGDILTVFPTVLDIRDWHVPYISSATFSSQSSLSTGDVVIADTAEDYTAGKALEVVISEGIKAVPGLHTIACHPKVSFAPGFLGYYLNSSAYKERLRPLIQGIKVYSISKSSLATTSISFPSHDEQYKIGLFLSIIDRRIAVQNKIIEALGRLKKAIYERIFGSDFFGATLQPLGDFMEIPKLEKEIRPDRSRLITVKLNEAGVVQNTNVESLKMSGTIYYKRSAGQFIYGKQNLFHGAFGIVPKELNGYCSSADVPSLSFSGGIEPSFLIRAISYCAYNWEKYSSGTGSKRIHEPTLLGLTVPIPAKEHIGRCKELLDLIDHKIECERKLLRLMEMQKRYLLAEMFI